MPSRTELTGQLFITMPDGVTWATSNVDFSSLKHSEIYRRCTGFAVCLNNPQFYESLPNGEHWGLYNEHNLKTLRELLSKVYDNDFRRDKCLKMLDLLIMCFEKGILEDEVYNKCQDIVKNAPEFVVDEALYERPYQIYNDKMNQKAVYVMGGLREYINSYETEKQD